MSYVLAKHLNIFAVKPCGKKDIVYTHKSPSKMCQGTFNNVFWMQRNLLVVSLFPQLLNYACLGGNFDRTTRQLVNMKSKWLPLEARMSRVIFSSPRPPHMVNEKKTSSTGEER